MLKNPLISKFLNKIKENRPPYKPKFEVGDFIMNDWNGKKIISEVIDVFLLDYKNLENLESGIGQYLLLDMVNDHSSKKPGDKIYNRYRDIQKIDSTYFKIKADVARILYGKKE